eukprot:14035229-Heterocapsa_arctica.AAC.1
MFTAPADEHLRLVGQGVLGQVVPLAVLARLQPEAYPPTLTGTARLRGEVGRVRRYRCTAQHDTLLRRVEF